MEQYYTVGKLVGTFGVTGELVLQHVLGKKTSLKGLEVIMVETKKDNLLPFFVSNTEVYIKLEDIDKKETAQKLVSKLVWLKEVDFKKYKAKDANISLLGYVIYDNEKALSEIIEVIEQPHQVLAKIIYESKEMLIPVHENFIIKIDDKNKKVILDLPEGLLDIYM
jgi:16S rRNA processing protein RimM